MISPSPSVSHEESIDDIKTSLTRIEQLLNRGHQLLYGPDGEEVLEPEPELYRPSLDSSPSYHTNDSVMISVSQSPGNNNNNNNSAYDHHHQQHRSERRSASRQASSRSPSASPIPGKSRTPPIGGVRPRRQAPRASKSPSRIGGGRTTHNNSPARRLLGLSTASKKRDRRLRNMEEGVDDDDVAQDISIEELKARIRKELEEYRKNGPLMPPRRKPQRSRSRGNSPPLGAKKSAVTPPRMARQQSTMQARTHTGMARKPAVYTGQPRAATMTSSAKPTAAGGSYYRRRPATGTTTTTTTAANPPVRRTTQPVMMRTRVAQSSLHSRNNHTMNSHAAATTSGGPAARGSVPIWERLYGDASVQRERLSRRRDQILMEEKEKIDSSCVPPNRRHKATSGLSPIRNQHQQHHYAPQAVGASSSLYSSQVHPGRPAPKTVPPSAPLRVVPQQQQKEATIQAASDSTGQLSARSGHSLVKVSSESSNNSFPHKARGAPFIVAPLDLSSLQR